MMKVLFRSERHLMFFGGYLGIGLVMVAQTVADSIGDPSADAIPSADLLAVPLLIAFFVITGLRFASDMPASLNANWVFRSSTEIPEWKPARLACKVMLLSVLPWEVLILAPITAQAYGWRIAAFHTATVVVASVLVVEGVLIGFRKISFTCSSKPDIKRLMFRLLATILSVTVAVPMFAGLEHWMLASDSRFILLGVLILLAFTLIERHKRGLPPEQTVLTFEDTPPPAFELLKLA